MHLIHALSRAQRLALSAASFLLLSIATMALGPLISGSGWWWLCAFMAAGTLFSGAGLRAIRTPPSLVPVLELVVLVLLLTLLFGGATSFALIVPTTGRSTSSASCSWAPSARSSSSRCPPSRCRRSSFGLALGVGVLAVLIDILGADGADAGARRGAALVPILIPGSSSRPAPRLPTLVLTAAAYLLLLRVDVRVRRRASSRPATSGDRCRHRHRPEAAPIASTLGASLGLAAVGLARGIGARRLDAEHLDEPPARLGRRRARCSRAA